MQSYPTRASLQFVSASISPIDVYFVLSSEDKESEDLTTPQKNRFDYSSVAQRD